jgi:condensin complex subunit 3
MPGRTLPEATAASVREQVSTTIPRILDQAQISLANHQKNLVAFYKLHTEAAQYTETVRRGNGVKLIGERIFEQMVMQMLTRVLPLKKGVTQADRVVKFVGGYIKFINEKGGLF